MLVYFGNGIFGNFGFEYKTGHWHMRAKKSKVSNVIWQKAASPTCQMLTDFQNSFIVKQSSKLVTKSTIKMPPDVSL